MATGEASSLLCIMRATYTQRVHAMHPVSLAGSVRRIFSLQAKNPIGYKSLDFVLGIAYNVVMHREMVPGIIGE